MGEVREHWHKTRMVPLAIYLEIAKAYHIEANHSEEDFVECEEEHCDNAHGVAFLSDEGYG